MRDLEIAKNLLQGDVTLALAMGEKAITKCTRGVAPLLELLDTGEDFSRFCAADRVVGRGAAFLYIALGIKSVYAGVISETALALLRRHSVYVEYSALTPRITNRAGDGFCPIEECVMNIDSTEEAIAAIKDRLKSLKK